MWWSRKTRDKTLFHSSIFNFQLLFKLERTQVSQAWMSSDAIVITFNIAKDFWFCLFNRLERAAFDQFRFESGKKAFCLRVVVAVSLRRHWLPKPIDIQQSAIFNWRILRTAIGMNNCAAPNQTTTSRPVQSLQNELRRHPLGDLPAEDPSGELILKCRQITEPSALQWQICNVANNHLSFAERLIDWIRQ